MLYYVITYYIMYHVLQVIVLERNRRVAKAYARAPVVTVNGSEEGFDGFRIGNSPFLS